MLNALKLKKMQNFKYSFLNILWFGISTDDCRVENICTGWNAIHKLYLCNFYQVSEGTDRHSQRSYFYTQHGVTLFYGYS